MIRTEPAINNCPIFQYSTRCELSLKCALTSIAAVSFVFGICALIHAGTPFSSYVYGAWGITAGSIVSLALQKIIAPKLAFERLRQASLGGGGEAFRESLREISDPEVLDQVLTNFSSAERSYWRNVATKEQFIYSINWEEGTYGFFYVPGDTLKDVRELLLQKARNIKQNISPAATYADVKITLYEVREDFEYHAVELTNIVEDQTTMKDLVERYPYCWENPVGVKITIPVVQ